MYVLFVLLAVAVVFAAAVLATGRVDGLSPAAVDRAGPALPVGRLAAGDVAAVTFAVGLRGYRMDQVDAVLDRLGGELAAREREIAELRAAREGSA